MAYPQMYPRRAPQLVNGSRSFGLSFPDSAPGLATEQPATAPRMSSTYNPTPRGYLPGGIPDPMFHESNTTSINAQNVSRRANHLDPLPDGSGGSTIIMPSGRVGAPVIAPAGSNVMYPGSAPGMMARGATGKTRDRAAIIKDLLGPPERIPYQYDMTKDKNGALVNPGKIIGGGGTKYRMTMEDAEKGADEQLGAIPGPGNPVGMTPPSIPGPSAPPTTAPSMIPSTQPTGTPMMHEPYPASAPGTNAAVLSDQAAREMWRQISTRQPDARQAAVEFHDTLRKYGIDGHGLLAHWSQGGTLGQEHLSEHPGTHMSMSMIGPNNGLDPMQKYGAVHPGATAENPVPSITTPSTFTSEPFPGFTKAENYTLGQPKPAGDTVAGTIGPKAGTATPTSRPAQARKLSADLAAQMLQQVGGDKDKARQLARQQGYSF